MPSFVPHLIAPVLVALAFFPMTRRQVLLWAPMVWAPDLDYFFARDQHRAVLGNIWWPTLAALVLYWLWRRRDPLSRFWEFATRPGTPGGLLLTCYYLLGHILMDLFMGGVPLFWPLTNASPFLGFAIFVDTASGAVDTVGEGGVQSDIPELSPVFPWLEYDHSAQLAFLAAMLLGWLAWRGVRRLRGHQTAIIVERCAIQKE